MHWACAKIAASLAIPDDALLEILLEKVSDILSGCSCFAAPISMLRSKNGLHFFLSFIFLVFQLRICKGISYAAVAAHADKSGRRKLTAMLVEHEPRSSKQVLVSCFFFIISLFLSFFLMILQWRNISLKGVFLVPHPLLIK